MRTMKNLALAATAATALALAGCGGGGTASTPMTPAEPPPPPVHAVALPDGHGLMDGMTSVPAGTTVVLADGTRISCAAGGSDCSVSVMTDSVTDMQTATSTGGMATVMTDAMYQAEMIAMNRQTLADAEAALEAIQTQYAAGDATANQVATAQAAVDAARMLPGNEDPPAPPPTAMMVSLPEGHGLMAGQFTVPAGGSVTTSSGAMVSCTGDEDCLVTVSLNDALGTYTAYATGGTAEVTVRETPPTQTAIALPAGNSVHAQLVTGGPTRLTIAAGNSADYGGVRFTCPADGPDCAVDFVDDLGSASASAPTGSGVATAGPIPNPAFGGSDRAGYLSNENLIAAGRHSQIDMPEEGSGRGFDVNGDGFKDFASVDAEDVGSIPGVLLTRTTTTVRLHSSVEADDNTGSFADIYGPHISPAVFSGFWSKIANIQGVIGTTVNFAPGSGPQGTITFGGTTGSLVCRSGICSVTELGGVYSGEGNWRFTPSNSTATTAVSDDSYIVFGYWQNTPTALPRQTQALWAGNDPFAAGNVAGLTGTATYNGGAVGHYESRGGTLNRVNRGTFTANAALTARFSEDRIHGTVNDFTPSDTSALPAGLSVTLRNAAISGNTFSGSVAMGTTADSLTGVTGSWEGGFFGNGPLAITHPSAVAGEFTAMTGSTTPRTGEVTGTIPYINLNGAFGAD